MPGHKAPSKAEAEEQGGPTYQCTFDGCDKKFGTSGHARRHERSHLDTAPFPCPHCDKSFKRSDVRAKHINSMHPGTSDIASNDSEGGSRKAQKREHDTSPRSTFSQSASMNQRQRSGSSASQSFQLPMMPSNGSWNGTPGSTAVDLGAIFSAPGPPMGMMSNQPDLMLTSTSGPTSYGLSTPSNGFLDPAHLHTGSSMQNTSIIDSTPDDLFGALSPNWPFFSHIFGWGLDNDVDRDLGIQPHMFENSESGPISSTENLSAAWLLSITPRGGSPADGKEQEEMKRDPFGRNHDNPWPNIFKPKMPDRPLTLGGVKASPRVDRPRGHPSAVQTTSHNAMLSLVYLSHQAMWLMPDIEDFPDQETLSDFVDLYFERFHSTFPILHQATFSQENTSAVLLLAVAAVGATYADREFRPLAVALSELVRRIVQWMRASDQRSKFDRNLLISYMLQTLVGVACGSREMMLHSEISRCSLVTSMRRLHLLRPGRSATEELLARKDQATVDEKWQAWVEDESRRRLGWGVYLLDAQISALLGVPAIASGNEADVSLPCNEKLWGAEDAVSWWEVLQAESRPSDTLSFSAELKAVFAGRAVRPNTSDFGWAIISHTMYRLSQDANGLSKLMFAEDVDIFMSPLAQNSKPSQALHFLARDSSPDSEPSHLRLCSAALFHHSRIAFLYPGLLEHAKIASGKYEPDISKVKAEAWIKEWAADVKGVRRAVWHAGVLNALLAEFPLGAFPEAFWAFDCALVFWAVGRYGVEGLKTTGPRPALFAANWFDVDPAPMWVEHGGQLILPFLGSTASITTHVILDHFISQLGRMPWGMAGMYKQVLERLVERV